MKRLSIVLAILLLLAAGTLQAHPGSGIVVDRQGNVYFIDTGSGIWMIDRSGKLTKLAAPAYHWMALDPDSGLRKTTLPNFGYGDAVVSRDRVDPRILVSSDFPIAVGRDGALLYPWKSSGGELQLFRMDVSGRTTVVKTLQPRSRSRESGWVNGLATAPDGSIYFTENMTIKRITPQGEITVVLENLTLAGCDSVPDVGPEEGPYFRGLAVDSQGTVYVAATGCRSVLKIAPGSKASTILRSPGPWSPTAVTVHDGTVYVLEYFHTPGDNRREWLPRVKKILPDGTVATIASIDRR